MPPPQKPLPPPEPSPTASLQKSGTPRPSPKGQPDDVAAIRAEIRSFLSRQDAEGRVIGNAKCGVYAFYDYDGEPIYIGQTFEGVRARISRHLTNQRTDAVAMNVLDPFEVAEIRVWILEPYAWFTVPEIRKNQDEIRVQLDRMEYTLYVKVISESTFGAVLNEKPPGKREALQLPSPHSGKIIPADIFPQRKHPDVRIARRASTIAALARVISERKVAKGLRTTLLTQARRLERLADLRLAEFAGSPDETEEEADA